MNNFYNTDMQPATMYNNQSSWGQMPTNIPSINRTSPMIQEPPILVIPVNGEQMAKMYPIERGRTVLLMDFTNKHFWIKSVKSNGLEEICDGYTFVSDADVSNLQLQQKQANDERDRLQQLQTNFVSRSEFEEVKKILDELTK